MKLALVEQQILVNLAQGIKNRQEELKLQQIEIQVEHDSLALELAKIKSDSAKAEEAKRLENAWKRWFFQSIFGNELPST